MDLITLALAKKFTTDSIAGLGALKGEDGDSAYEIAVENGFAGTEAEWLKSLKGERGTDGINGKNGIDGQNGTDGIGITSTEINESGELVLTYSDGSTANVGVVVGNDYVLTDTDKTDIANIVINEFDSSVMAILGVDENVTE